MTLNLFVFLNLVRQPGHHLGELQRAVIDKEHFTQPSEQGIMSNTRTLVFQFRDGSDPVVAAP